MFERPNRNPEKSIQNAAYQKGNANTLKIALANTGKIDALQQRIAGSTRMAKMTQLQHAVDNISDEPSKFIQTGETKSSNDTLQSNTPIQRAIGAEIETNLQVKQNVPGGAPMTGSHEELVGTINTPFGTQRIVIDSSTILEITTDPKERRTINMTSELPELVKYLAGKMKSPGFGIDLAGKFQAGTVGFKSGTTALLGDIQLNVSPLDATSVLKYYEAVGERRNTNEAAADDNIERGPLRIRYYENEQLSVIREAINQATRLAIAIHTRKFRLQDAQGTENIRATEAILIRAILDLVMNSNLRQGDSATDKNKLDVLPKFDIQQRLNDYSLQARTLRVDGKSGNEKAILYSSMQEALEGSYRYIKDLKKSNALLNIINDTYDVVVKGRRTIRNRAGDAAGNQQMDPLISNTTSTNMIPESAAEHGVYEDRNPFRESLEMGSVPATSWFGALLKYELELWNKGVHYLKP